MISSSGLCPAPSHIYSFVFVFVLGGSFSTMPPPPQGAPSLSPGWRSLTHTPAGLSLPSPLSTLRSRSPQNDFVSGSLKVGTDAEAVVGPINKVRQDINFGFVVHTQDSHPPDHVSFHDNHEGVEVFQSIKIPAPDGTEVDQVHATPKHLTLPPTWPCHPPGPATRLALPPA